MGSSVEEVDFRFDAVGKWAKSESDPKQPIIVVRKVGEVHSLPLLRARQLEKLGRGAIVSEGESTTEGLQPAEGELAEDTHRSFGRGKGAKK